MDLKKTFGTNKEAEINGVWHTIGNARLKIARVNNPNYQRVLRRLVSPSVTIVNANSEESQEKIKDITLQAMGKAILVDWENLKEDEQEISYSPEAAYRILKEYPDFLELVSQKATDLKFYRDEYLEENEKK